MDRERPEGLGIPIFHFSVIQLLKMTKGLALSSILPGLSSFKRCSKESVDNAGPGITVSQMLSKTINQGH